MMASVNIQVLNRLSMMLLPVLLMTLVKSALFCTMVAMLIRVFRLTSARVRYVLWVSVVSFVLFIAIYTFFYPILNLASLRISIRKLEENQLLSSLLLPRHDTWVFAKDHAVVSSALLRDELKLSTESFHWSFWAVCVWIAGSVLCFLYTVTGRIGVRYISRNASPPSRNELTTIIARHACDLGITREIRVIVSRKCRLSFTYGLIHPVLVVPYEATVWPETKLRAVLIHELAHIQRYDHSVLLFSRLVCATFWFIPVVWVAHSRLQLEQENLCDLIAIQKGERPTVYARYMVDLARTARSLVLLSGIFIMKGRKNMLMKRVTNVLNPKGSILKGGTIMKARTFVSILILVLAVLIIAGSCATEKITYISKEYEIYGTWVNTDYDDTNRYSKVVVYPNGIIHYYRKNTDTVVSIEEEFVIANKWIDSKGNIYYTTRNFAEIYPGWTFSLYKINNSGKNLEYDWSFNDYPKEIDPQKSGEYHIYYRQ